MDVNVKMPKSGLAVSQNDQAQEQFEMSVRGENNPSSPTTLSRRSSMAPLRVDDPQEGVNVQELPPVDGGWRAWTFCLAAFLLETMVWGFGFRSVPLCSRHSNLCLLTM